MTKQIKVAYKITKLTTVVSKENGDKEIIEKELVGKHTHKEIKESLPENEVMAFVEYEDKEIEFDLETFNELRKQSLI